MPKRSTAWHQNHKRAFPTWASRCATFWASLTLSWVADSRLDIFSSKPSFSLSWWHGESITHKKKRVSRSLCLLDGASKSRTSGPPGARKLSCDRFFLRLSSGKRLHLLETNASVSHWRSADRAKCIPTAVWRQTTLWRYCRITRPTT